jgi:class 3 adenylate cyclase
VTATFDAPGKALRAAASLRRELTVDDPDHRFGIGVHVGECTSTGLGMRGDAVDVAHRLALAAAPRAEVLVTAMVEQLVRASELDLDARPDLADGAVFSLVD